MKERDAIEPMINGAEPIRPQGSQLIRLSDVQPVEVEWLWRHRFPLGKLSIVSGDPGLGKSLLGLAIAASVSLGARWPVDGGNAPKGDVILLSAEDGLADTIRPRLDAMGADVSRIHAFGMVRYLDESGEQGERHFSLERDVELLSSQLALLPHCKLIVIDPISAYLGSVDSHKNADVRGLLAPLSEVGERHGVSIIGITHLNKGGGKAIYRTMGSLAFVAAARAAWGVVKDDDEPARRLVLPVKTNLAPEIQGLAYRVESNEDGRPVLAWEAEPVSTSMDAALYQDDGRTERDEAAEWLRELLRNGPMTSKEVKDAARDAGVSWRTIERAKSKAGAEPFKTEFSGKWSWRLKNEVRQGPSVSNGGLRETPETRAVAGFEADSGDELRRSPPPMADIGSGGLGGDGADTEADLAEYEQYREEL